MTWVDEVTPPIALRELDERVNTGLRVKLVLEPTTRTPLIQVYEGLEKTTPDLQFPVPPEKAAEAFQHPYAYAP